MDHWCLDVTTLDPATGVRDLELPGMIEKRFPQHGPYFGVYAEVVEGGEVRVGDRLVFSGA